MRKACSKLAKKGVTLYPKPMAGEEMSAESGKENEAAAEAMLAGVRSEMSSLLGSVLSRW